jgi:hypothetical protein
MPQTLFINNTPDANTTVNPLGNQIQILLNPPIHLDNKKKYIMRIISAQILYCFTNIFTGINNKIYYTYKGSSYTIVFPQGLYTLAAISDEIMRQTNNINNQPYIISVQGDAANSSVYIVFNDPTVTVDCNHSDSLLINLGYPMSTGIIGPFSESGTQFSLGAPAVLNTTTSLLMTCDSCAGSYKNGNASSIVASILINATPFTIIDYEPFNPPKITVTKYDIDSLTFTLFNQNLQPLDLNSNGGSQAYEAWSSTIEINEYDEKTGRLI